MQNTPRTILDKRIVRRLLKGLGASFYGQLVVTLIQLAGVPILLRYWHVQLYGEWLILFAIPSYLSMTDLGFSQSAANDMTARVARGDKAGALEVFQSLSTLVFLVASGGLILVAVAVVLLPLDSWVHFSVLTTREVRWVLWLLAAEVLVKLMDGINHAGFRSNGDYALHVSLYYSTLLAQYSSIWLLAAFGYGPVAAGAAFLGIRVLVTPSVGVLLRRRHRWVHFAFWHTRLGRLRALLRPALANTALPLAQLLNVQGMLLLVGAILGPVAVVTFSTLRTLTRSVLQLVFTVSNAAEPELASAFGSGNRPLLRVLYHHAMQAGLWLALTAALGLALTGSRVLRLWTHGSVTMYSQLFHWLLASAVATVLWHSSLTLLKAANRHLHAAAIYATMAVLALLVAGFLLRATGDLRYIGMILLLMDSAMAAYTLRAAAHLCDSSVASALLSAFNPVALFGLLRKGSPAV